MLARGEFPIEPRVLSFFDHDLMHIFDFSGLPNGREYSDALKVFAKFALTLRDEVLEGKTKDWFKHRGEYVGEFLTLPDLNQRREIEEIFQTASRTASVKSEKASILALNETELRIYIERVLRRAPALIERHGGAVLDSFNFFRNQSVAEITSNIENFRGERKVNFGSNASQTLLGIVREIYFASRSIGMTGSIDNVFYLTVDQTKPTSSKIAELRELVDHHHPLNPAQAREFIIDSLARLQASMRVGLALELTPQQLVLESAQLIIPETSATAQFINVLAIPNSNLSGAFGSQAKYADLLPYRLRTQ